MAKCQVLVDIIKVDGYEETIKLFQRNGFRIEAWHVLKGTRLPLNEASQEFVEDRDVVFEAKYYGENEELIKELSTLEKSVAVANWLCYKEKCELKNP